MKFKDIVLGENGLLKGPFGSDLKKSIYIPKSKTTFKVYLQENILKRDITKGNHYISSEYFHSSMSRYEVHNGDFIVTCDGTLGEILQLNKLSEPGIISSSLLRITLDPKIINDKFFLYFFKHRIKNPLIRQHDNSVLKHLPGLKAIREFEFDLLDIKTQIPIGKLLSSLDSKIELNNRINTELEAMAKTLYDYWFVQFDFPNSKGKPYKTSGGKMVWNEELKREIPEGWENGRFGDYAKLKGGFAFKSAWWSEEGLPVIKIKDINENYTLSIENCSFVSEDKYSIAKNYEAKTGDVVIALTGATVGKYGIMTKSDKPVLVNQRVGLFKLGDNPTNKLPFLINSLNQEYFRKTVFVLASGAAQPNISTDQIDEIPLVIPSKEILDQYNSTCSSFYETIINHQSENQKLTELRDWLLPMLMNGQVKVKEENEIELSMAAEPNVKYGK